MLRIIYAIIFSLITTFSACAQDTDISVQIIHTSNSEFELKIHVPHGWNLYSNSPGDLGEPFMINLRHTKNIEKYKVVWPESLESSEDIGGVKFRYRYYEGDIVIPVEIQRYDNAHEADAEVHLDYSICSTVCMKKSKVLKFNSSAAIESDTYLDYLYFALLALIGGFILNFMPCVLPVLSLKINSMVKATNIVQNSLYTVLGVIFAFNILIVITCVLKTIGSNIGWGLQFQNPYYISCIIVILIFFAIAVYKDSIVFLPSKMQSYLATYSSAKESINAFITGVVSTMLALPCTAPFLGGAIAFALSRGILEIALIFNVIAIGFSLPYLILAFFPSLLKMMPKPGHWMVTFKKFLAALLIFTAVWFLFILSAQVDYWYAAELLIVTLIISYILFTTRLGKAARFYCCIALIGVVVLFNALDQKFSEKKRDDVYTDLVVKIADSIDRGKVVLVNITADWCLTCKYNEYMVLSSMDVKRFIQDNDIVYINVDYTHQDERILNFIKQHNRYGIPFTIVFGSKAKKGEVLPEVLVASTLIERLKAVN